MVAVWRVENDQGQGPYRGSRWPRQDDMVRSHAYRETRWRRPVIQNDLSDDDCVNFALGDYVCGFSSRAAASKWFHGWTKQLAAAGFSVKQFEVDPKDILYGQQPYGQVAFKRPEGR